MRIPKQHAVREILCSRIKLLIFTFFSMERIRTLSFLVSYFRGWNFHSSSCGLISNTNFIAYLWPWRSHPRNYTKTQLRSSPSVVKHLTHYNDVIMSMTTSQITCVSIVYSTVCSSADHRKHQSPASLAFVQGIHRWPVNSPHKWPVARKMFPLDDIIMIRRLMLHCEKSARIW